MPKKTKTMAKRTAKNIKKTVAKAIDKTKANTKKKCSLKPPKVEQPFNKSEIANSIADMVCVSKKEANRMLDALFEIIAAHLKKRGGPGEFTLPNVAKFKVVTKPATKARQGINPFTGSPMTFAAKPSRKAVKVKPLKKIKDAAK